MLPAVASLGCHATGAKYGMSRSVEVWRVDPASSEKPPVWFSFPEPFQIYAGEFPRVEGELRFDDQGASGWFRVPILEVTLGEADLDSNVRNNMEMLAGKQHSTSTVSVRAIRGLGPDLRSGASVTLLGELELKGVKVTIQSPATLEESGSDGARFRTLRGRFVIDRLRERFNILGPGTDDEPQGDRVEVFFDVTLARVLE